MESLEQQLLSANVVLMAAGAWFILWVLKKIWKGMSLIKWVKQFKPLYPAIICQVFVWIPGAMPDEPEPTLGARILMGLWCGFLASIGYQLLKRFLDRHGVVLPENPEDLVPDSDSEKNEQESEESSDSESRITPIETPIPRSVKKEEEDSEDGKEKKS